MAVYRGSLIPTFNKLSNGLGGDIPENTGQSVDTGVYRCGIAKESSDHTFSTYK